MCLGANLPRKLNMQDEKGAQREGEGKWKWKWDWGKTKKNSGSNLKIYLAVRICICDPLQERISGKMRKNVLCESEEI